MSDVSTIELKDIPPRDFMQLFRLNMHDSGLMQDVLRRFKEKEGCRVYLIRKDAQIVAWACVFKKKYSRKHTAYFYVKKDSRRKGLGTLLTEAVKADYNKVIVSVGTKNKEFFKVTGLK